MAFTGGDYELARPLDRSAASHRGSRGSSRDRARALRAWRWAHARATLPRHSGATSRPARPCRTSTTRSERDRAREPRDRLPGDREPARAREASEAALELYEKSGDLDGLAVTTLNMAFVELRNDDLPAAARRLGEALAWSERLGHREVLAYAVGYAAELALARATRRRGRALRRVRPDVRADRQRAAARRGRATRTAVERLATEIDVEEPIARGHALPSDAVTSLVRETWSPPRDRRSSGQRPSEARAAVGDEVEPVTYEASSDRSQATTPATSPGRRAGRAASGGELVEPIAGELAHRLAVERARRDGVDRDTRPRQRRGRPARQRDQRRLRRRVVGADHARPEGRVGGDVDDAPTASLASSGAIAACRGTARAGSWRARRPTRRRRSRTGRARRCARRS